MYVCVCVCGESTGDCWPKTLCIHRSSRQLTFCVPACLHGDQIRDPYTFHPPPVIDGLALPGTCDPRGTRERSELSSVFWFWPWVWVFGIPVFTVYVCVFVVCQCPQKTGHQKWTWTWSHGRKGHWSGMARRLNPGSRRAIEMKIFANWLRPLL